MVYFDAVDWSSQSGLSLAQAAVQLGFTGIIFNQHVDPPAGKLPASSKSLKHGIPNYHVPLASTGRVRLSEDSLAAAGVLCSSSAPAQNELLQVSRVTVHLSNPSQLPFLGNIAASNAFDLVAAAPVDERTWLALVSRGEFDIISLDLCMGRLPFVLRRQHLSQLIRRNVYFEIRFAEALQDVACRRHLFTNVQQLVRFVPHDHIIFSSGASNSLGIRAPYDVINLAQIIGISTGAKHVISNNIMKCLYKGCARRTAGGSIGTVTLPTFTCSSEV